MKDYKISVNCAFGAENVLKRELAQLGFLDLKADNGSFVFDGTSQDIADCNMFLRTAERVFVVIGGFEATTFDDLYEGIYSIDWQDYLVDDAKIVVNAKSVKSELFALSAIQSVAKKAIIKKLALKTGKNIFLENGAAYGIEINLLCNKVVVLLDTSGDGLHKRGYRDYVSVAPIKETLACTLLLLSDFKYDKPFCDPFCGSGTIVLEAARIALNIASGFGRDFAYCHWKNFNQSAYTVAKQRAFDTQCLDRKIDFWGSDIDSQAIKLTQRHAERAGLATKVRFDCLDVKDFCTDKIGGTIVTNPPYGERLMDVASARKLIEIFGDKCRNLCDWSVFAISADETYERFFGKRADKKRKLFNAQKECNFFQYFKQSNPRCYFTALKDFVDKT